MRRRNFGLSDEDRLYSISMEKADKNDLLAIAGYLFIITKNIDNELIFDEEQCFTILANLAENLSLKERLDKVVFNYVYDLQLAGKLHYHENFGNEEIEEDDSEVNYDDSSLDDDQVEDDFKDLVIINDDELDQES
jgi:hypothetical protein